MSTTQGLDPNLVNKDSFNKVVKGYDNYFLLKNEKAIVEKYFKGKILDVGCGCGRTTVVLHKSGYDIIGIDVADEMIDYASKKFPEIDFRVMSVTNLGFQDGYFDAVFFSYCGPDYIHPYANRMQAMREMLRVLKSGGVFVFSSHNSLSLTAYFKNVKRLRTTFRNFFSVFRNSYRTENTGGNPLITYYTRPGSMIKDLRKIGFVRPFIFGNYFKEVFFNSKPYYIAFKP